MGRIFLCGNTGCVNHGCEAIIRSTTKLLEKPGGDIYLCTFDEASDRSVAGNIGINLIPYNKYPSALYRYFSVGARNLTRNPMFGQSVIQKPLFDRLQPDDVCLTIGGDTYCYGEPTSAMALNLYTQKKGIKNILWCHSIEENVVADKRMKKDLLKYDKIFARDPLTAAFLLKHGIPKEKIVRCCDPAFFLDAKETPLPEGFDVNNTVGINISTGVIKDSHPLVYQNVLRMARHILDQTDMSICLIPHVYSVKKGTGDHLTMRRLKKDLNDPRVSIIDTDLNCEELKYIISKCRFLVCARTHASIAGYSTGVPTLVLGYSVKSKGIATDLFGTYEDYVLPYTEIQHEDELLNAFLKLCSNEEAIKERYQNVLPAYKRQLTDAIEKYFSGEENKGEVCSKDICTGCSACVSSCPKHCISMVRDADGFDYPGINLQQCISCGKCRMVCPALNKFRDDGKQPDVYCIRAASEELVQGTSSGGISTLLAEHILDQKGVVFGAAFGKTMEVSHVVCRTKQELQQLKGSKYVQSTIGDTYVSARNFLEKGKQVLFVGTPCQIGGLKAYLQKDYANLYTVDMICHGVPAPGLWQKYLEHIAREYKSQIRRVCFRDKTTGWRNFSLSIAFENGQVYRKKVSEEPWMHMLLSDLSCRKSCSQCSFKQIHRESDITVGDFWAVRHLMPELDDDKGMSLVFVHSEKGHRLLKAISDAIMMKHVEWEDVIEYSPSYEKSHEQNPMRKRFLLDAEKMSMTQLIKKYDGNTISARLRRKWSRFVG